MDYDGLSLHGIVDLHKARFAEDQVPRTIKDHIILDGVTDLPVLRTTYSRIFRSVKQDGEYHDLLGSVYLLGKRRGGRQPERVGDDPPRGFDKLKLDPAKAMIVSELRQIAAREDHAYANTAPAVRTMANAVAKVGSRRQQIDMIGGALAVDQELAFKQQENEYLKRENELLRSGRVAASPSGLLEGASGRYRTARNRPDTLPHSNGNGNRNDDDTR